MDRDRGINFQSVVKVKGQVFERCRDSPNEDIEDDELKEWVQLKYVGVGRGALKYPSSDTLTLQILEIHPQVSQVRKTISEGQKVKFRHSVEPRVWRNRLHTVLLLDVTGVLGGLVLCLVPFLTLH